MSQVWLRLKLEGMAPWKGRKDRSGDTGREESDLSYLYRTSSGIQRLSFEGKKNKMLAAPEH